jgi:putative transposase
MRLEQDAEARNHGTAYSSVGSVVNFSGFHLNPDGAMLGSPREADRRVRTVIDFKRVHYPKAVILHAVFFYARYAVSYRDIYEILAERGVALDHATLNRWLVKSSQLIAATAQAKKRAMAKCWRMDDLCKGSRQVGVSNPSGQPRRINP